MSLKEVHGAALTGRATHGTKESFAAHESELVELCSGTNAVSSSCIVQNPKYVQKSHNGNGNLRRINGLRIEIYNV
ncbi:unnamed protein product [Nezara viridula]|uniref:Uncharacterized protein n=1 Tax=Nezara viridula TaxID=85310 RepID=A0A9P0HQI8_NEZVI|nr:unnamed protein product [Nezara viridula]